MQYGGLLGRERETADLAARVIDVYARLTTLVGPGGVGKSALAMHVADRPEMGARLAAALCWFWTVRGHLSGAEYWLEHTWSRNPSGDDR